MIIPISNTLSLCMIYTGFKRVGTWWNYKNVISPFYRLYYIEDGKGKVYINDTPYELTPGTLFLIPKFTFHSYECDDFMDHYYICLFDDLLGNSGIPNPLQMNLQVNMNEIDPLLIKRYIELNPYKNLTESDPKHYDNNKSIYELIENKSYYNTAKVTESNGILLQLFSRFITENSIKKLIPNNLNERLDLAIQHINKNIETRISIPELADLACLTPDHFSRVFKKIMGMSPCEYIQMKRIERAQILLVTSNMNIVEIGEKVGIDNPPQFTRLFKKIAQCSPKEYRIKQLSI